jgi:hypothetical protein
MHMFDEHALNTTIKENLDLLCDVETFLGLSYIILCLNVCNLCQRVQVRDVFICDFVDVIKTYEIDIYTNYMLIQL